MKALSIRQPWAWAILQAGKRVENRNWRGCSYRGPILIHASKSATARDIADDFEAVENMSMLSGATMAPGPVTIRMLLEQSGGIVGKACLIGEIKDEAMMRRAAVDRDNRETHDGRWLEQQRPWWTGGYGLVLANVEPLPFVPWSGALGLFEVPDDYAERAVK